MTYIITSKTRRRTPNGKTVVMEHRESGERRICDERYADQKHAKYPGSGWSEPRAPGSQAPISRGDINQSLVGE